MGNFKLEIFLPCMWVRGVGGLEGVAGLKVIIMFISVQVELDLNLTWNVPTGTDIGENKKK